MIKNDTFFKILFAIELALLPLIVYAYNFIDNEWVTILFVVAVFLCRVWTELFKDKESFKSQLINAIGAVITFAFVFIFFACIKEIEVFFAVAGTLVVLFAYTLKLSLFSKRMPEIIEAVDFCSIVFECLAMLFLAFVSKAQFLANIGVISVLITGGIGILYRIYYAFKYTNLRYNIKKIFRRK